MTQKGQDLDPIIFGFLHRDANISATPTNSTTTRGRWKCRSGKCRSDNGWKAVRKEKYKIPQTWAEHASVLWQKTQKPSLCTLTCIKGSHCSSHRCDKRLQRLQKNFCKRVYYFVNVYLNKNHMSETKQNYDEKPSYSALCSNRSLIDWFSE